MTCPTCDALRAQVAELREALAAWVWAHEYKGSLAGDSRASLLASELAIARANQELIEEARRKSAVLLSTPLDERTRDLADVLDLMFLWERAAEMTASDEPTRRSNLRSHLRTLRLRDTT